MPLSPGARLGPYEVVAPLGAGGMGEVYRARDTRVDRPVALKVLPEEFFEDEERRARFGREAKLLASLNHPGIATLYSFEESSGRHLLAMELVEGEDLAGRLSRGAIPVEEAIAIAKQIAEGLEAAHERGIVHRDLKPANIKVTPDGAVKILDFGLAKAWEDDAAATSSSGLSRSPTMSRQMTDAGLILGTAAYMSPEQARGRSVDKRTDIWAFGVVVFEMLTGQRLFSGETVSDTLAAVLMRDPDWTKLPAGTPARLRHLLERCLERDAKQRLRDIGEARVELAKIEQGAPGTSSGSIPAADSPPAPPLWRRAVPWTLLTLAGAALVVMLAMQAPWRAVQAPAPVRLLARVGSDARLFSFVGSPPMALSPDGSTLAFTAAKDATVRGSSQLFVRRLDQLQAVALPGTEGASNPFFSPDGQWLAFFAADKLKKAPVAGGAVVTLCDARNPRGGTWADDDTIVFSPEVGSTGLMRIAAAGGTPSGVGTLAPGMLTQRWPHALPGARSVLYTEHKDITDFDAANLVVAPIGGGAPKIVVRGGSHGRYLPSGHLVYLHKGRLVAVRFDLARLEAVGRPVPVLDGVTADSNVGVAQWAVSSTGTLVFVPGTAAGQANPIDWMTRDGRTSLLRATASDWENPVFSPDGQRLAMDISDGKQRDIFLYEWAGDRLTQLTFDPSNERAPAWSPDGKRITFSSDRASPGIGNLYSMKADGTGGLERLTDSPADQRPGSWHPSGRFLVFEETDRAGSSSVMILPTAGDAATGLKPGGPTPFVGLGTTARGGLTPSFSPDGRWIAYRGEDGAYVRPFPGPGGQWKVRIDDAIAGAGNSWTSGRFPRWSAAGNELVLLTGSRVVAAPYAVVGDEFRAGTAEPWSPTEYQLFGLRIIPYAVHPDGERLAILARRDRANTATDEIVFIFNFFDELRRLVPAAKR